MKEAECALYCDWDHLKMPFSFIRNNLVYVIGAPSSVEYK